jgi:hypothetical protein
VAASQQRDTSGERQPAQGDEKNAAEKNSEKENLEAGLACAHREKKSGRETKRDDESDH